MTQPSPSTQVGLADIEIPPHAGAPVAPMLSVLVVAILLTLGALAWHRRRSQRATARRKIARLRAALDQQALSARAAAFALSQTLRAALRLPHVSAAVHLPPQLEEHRARWTQFAQQLSVARYAAEDRRAAEVHALCDDALFWLRHWR